MARSFADSAGTIWEVLEVHRSSSKPGAVSTGLEQGWLSFTSATAKRRLAPIPAEWESSPDPELERLCSAARVVPLTAPTFDPGIRDRRRKEGEALEQPDTGERRRASDDAETQQREVTSPPVKVPAESDEAGVEATVRRFAHEARARGQPAIDAMVQLKALLQAQFGEGNPDSRDIKRVRRWFVETYYFEPKL